MKAASRLRRRMALVELAAHRETVEAMLAQNYSKKMIHEKLTEEGKFSMAYITFCQQLRNEKRREAEKSRPAATSAAKAVPAIRPQPQPQNRPGIIRSNEAPFPDPRTIDPKTLI